MAKSLPKKSESWFQLCDGYPALFENESESESNSEYDDKVFVIHSGRRSVTYHGDSQGTQCRIWNKANANDKIRKSKPIYRLNIISDILRQSPFQKYSTCL